MNAQQLGQLFNTVSGRFALEDYKPLLTALADLSTAVAALQEAGFDVALDLPRVRIETENTSAMSVAGTLRIGRSIHAVAIDYDDKEAQLYCNPAAMDGTSDTLNPYHGDAINLNGEEEIAKGRKLKGVTVFQIMVLRQVAALDALDQADGKKVMNFKAPKSAP
jgi:hypothetical protein